MSDPSTMPTIPDHAALRELLSAEGAPPHLILDIGGSADIDGDGLVRVTLGNGNGELIFEDV